MSPLFLSVLTQEEVRELMREVIDLVDFPLLITDQNGNPRAWKNLSVDPDAFSAEELAHPQGLRGDPRYERLLEELRALKSKCEPVPIPGAALRKKRREMGLLQRDVAAASGVSVAFVSHLETGRTHLVRESFGGLKKFLPEPLDKLDNLRWLKVSSVRKKKPSYKFVYDLSVPGVETFLAGYPGIFVHNTFTIANVIAELQRPTLIISHNKTLAAQLYGELRNFFLKMR